MSNWLKSIFGGNHDCKNCDHCSCGSDKDGHKEEKPAATPVENVEKAQ
ncbi:MAG: hypothetical protein WCN88_03430 [Candidatus Falkowbacteria bacterium]